METRTLKIRTIYGKLFTVKVQEQTSTHIIGHDKFGLFVKLPLSEIAESEPSKDMPKQEEVQNG
jgi:hypothetical protein